VKVRREIPNGPEAAIQARRLLDAFSTRVRNEILDDARLVLSELVTNSYMHAGNPEGTPIEVVLDLSASRLRMEVIDGSIFDPTPETPEELRSAKWGLHLVDSVADEWGRVSEGGVWAELHLGQE
jgi:anti-sigma regulatory factor (Ser/Thr protein kinase)